MMSSFLQQRQPEPFVFSPFLWPGHMPQHFLQFSEQPFFVAQHFEHSLQHIGQHFLQTIFSMIFSF
jgi:hypothetical protein